MSRVAKYRRQVSEDPDIDNLLSTLSPEEMEQLEKELDAGDPDAGVSAGFNRSQTERASHQREAERERFAQNKAPVDHEKVQEKIKEKPKPEEKKTEQKTQDTHSSKGSEDVKDAKTRRSAFRRDNEKPKDTQVTKLAEKLGEDSNTKDKDKTERAQSRKPIEEKSIKQTGKDKENIKKAEEKEKTKETTDKKAEDKREKPPERTTINKTPATKEKAVSNKTAPEENALKEEGKKNLPKTVEPGSEIPENGTQNQTDSNKEDESSSIFNDLLEKVKNNDSEIIDLNLNNSDCITIETLMSFTEALEFNTMVKIFSLANTRADDHIALAISAMLKSNKTITSINLDSNQITGKGILAIFRALQHNTTLTELRFHNQRHICGGKTEMEIAKILKENTTLLKLGYHFELAGPRMTVTNLLSRNMDKQRQRRLAEQRMSQGTNNKKDCLEVPKVVPPQKASPKSSPLPSKKNAQKVTSKKGDVPTPPPPPPPLAPLAPPLINENIRNSLSPASQRRIVEKTGPSEKNSRDELLESIRSSNIKQLKKVEVPKWLK